MRLATLHICVHKQLTLDFCVYGIQRDEEQVLHCKLQLLINSKTYQTFDLGRIDLKMQATYDPRMQAYVGYVSVTLECTRNKQLSEMSTFKKSFLTVIFRAQYGPIWTLRTLRLDSGMSLTPLSNRHLTNRKRK